ncbi:LexA family transcriptional regulator [Dielma fastidiosa]|uniref:Repressor LexA n=1 Tax=Dielma fastidiosa TaxID=1034346 RepID=A0A318KHS2_9FIRM|nr:XRE family transcriptional regulator [Dielma fastidiosa]PXX77381.1 repressor LexA [Dielma fastidiosa]
MYKRYEQLLQEKGLTSYRVSKDTGITQSSLSDWKIGKCTPKFDKLKILADYFNVDLEYLTGTSDVKNAANAAVKEAIIKKAFKVPVVGAVPAGIPLEAIEEILDYEEISEETAKKGEYFGLKIKGDSMYPFIMEGDVVIVRKQDTIESGQVAIVMVNGDEATCKKVVIKNGGIVLVGHNPEFTPLYYSAEEVETMPVRIIGKVIEIRRAI